MYIPYSWFFEVLEFREWSIFSFFAILFSWTGLPKAQADPLRQWVVRISRGQISQWSTSVKFTEFTYHENQLYRRCSSTHGVSTAWQQSNLFMYITWSSNFQVRYYFPREFPKGFRCYTINKQSPCACSKIVCMIRSWSQTMVYY